MKRLITSVVFLLVVFGTTLSAQTLTVGSVSGSCGKNVTVPVNIGSTSGLLAVQFEVSYDKTKVTATNAVAGSLTSGFSFVSNLSTPGVVKIAMASGAGVSGSGAVANISFSIAAATSGTVSLPISKVLINDVSKAGTDGKITASCLQPPATAPTYVFPENGAKDVVAPVTLQWNAVAGAETYKVYLGADSPKFYDDTRKTSLSVDVAGGTKYFWYVKAANDAGNGPAGATWSFTTGGAACPTPAAPVASAPATVSSGTGYDVSWGAVAGANEYALEESTSDTFAGATATTTASTKLSFAKTVAAESQWYYRVRAKNTASGCNVASAWSATLAVKVVPVVKDPPLPPGARVLAAVASTDGAGGARFRTTLQLHNPTSGRLRGRIVYHAAGVAGGSADPSMPYDLGAGQTISYLDLLPAMGINNSFGSIDLIPEPLGSALPLFVTRIYNDGGVNGTSGMTLDATGLEDALLAGEKGVVVAPMDPLKMRMNVGIRTLGDGATFTITVRDKAGMLVTSKQVSYPPTYFIQHSAEGLTGVPVTGDATLTFAMEAGSAIIYASTTDNTTQDTQVQIARPIE